MAEPADPTRFRCKHCGKLPPGGMSPELMQLVGDLEEFFGVTFTINSGYRCPAHNAKTKGASPKSRHMHGDAADLKVIPSVMDVVTLADVARMFGADGVGTYAKHGFVHVDTGGRKASWVG